MGVSIQQYRQRIGCFARVATILSSVKVRGYKRNTIPKQSKDCGTALRVIIRLSCLVALIAAVIPSSSFVVDLTQFGDVEKNPGPKSVSMQEIFSRNTIQIGQKCKQSSSNLLPTKKEPTENFGNLRKSTSSCMFGSVKSEILIRDHFSNLHTIKIDLFSNGENLSQVIAAEFGEGVLESCNVTFGTKKVNEEKTLYSQGIFHGSTVKLHLKLHGGGKDKKKKHKKESKIFVVKDNPETWTKAQVKDWFDNICKELEIDEEKVLQFTLMNGKGLNLLLKEEWLRRLPDLGDLLFRMWNDLKKDQRNEQISGTTDTKNEEKSVLPVEKELSPTVSEKGLSSATPLSDSLVSQDGNPEVNKAANESAAKVQFGKLDHINDIGDSISLDQLVERGETAIPAENTIVCISGICCGKPESKEGRTIFLRDDPKGASSSFNELKIDIRANNTNKLLYKKAVEKLLQKISCGTYVAVLGRVEKLDQDYVPEKDGFEALKFKLVVDSDDHSLVYTETGVVPALLSRQQSQPSYDHVYPATVDGKRLNVGNFIKKTNKRVFCKGTASNDEIKKFVIAFKNSFAGDIFVGVEESGKITGMEGARGQLTDWREKMGKAIGNILPGTADSVSFCENDEEATTKIGKECFISVMELGDCKSEVEKICVIAWIHVPKGLSAPVYFSTQKDVNAFVRVGAETKGINDFHWLLSSLKSLSSRNIQLITSKELYIEDHVDKTFAEKTEVHHSPYKVLKIITGPESNSREFKMIFGNNPVKKIVEEYMAEYCCGFLNSNPGTIYFGVQEDEELKVGHVIGIVIPPEQREELAKKSFTVLSDFYPPVNSSQVSMLFRPVSVPPDRVFKYPKTYLKKSGKCVLLNCSPEIVSRKWQKFIKVNMPELFCRVIRVKEDTFCIVAKDLKSNAEQFMEIVDKFQQTNASKVCLVEMDESELQQILKDLCLVEIEVDQSSYPIHMTKPLKTYYFNDQGQFLDLKPEQLVSRFKDETRYDFDVQKFLNDVDHFDPSGNSYFMVTSPFNLPASQRDLSSLVIPKWTLSIDFDQDPKEEGHFFQTFQELHDHYQKERDRSLVTPDDNLDLNADHGICWLAARGHRGIATSLSEETQGRPNWHKTHRRKIVSLLNQEITRNIKPSKLHVVVFWDEGYCNLVYSLNILLGEILSINENTAITFVCSTVAAHSDVSKSLIEDLKSNYGNISTNVHVSSLQVLATLLACNLSKTYRPEDDYQVPQKVYCENGSFRIRPTPLPQRLRQNINGRLEIMYMNKSGNLDEESLNKERTNFYSGSQLTLLGLSGKIGIEREKMSDLEQAFKSLCNDNKSRVSLIVVKADRGAGTTTMCLQFLFKKHERFPCAQLIETHRGLLSSIEKINQITNLPVLLLVDEEVANLQEFLDFKKDAEGRRNVNIIFLLVEPAVHSTCKMTYKKSTASWAKGKKSALRRFGDSSLYGTSSYEEIELRKELKPKEMNELTDELMEICSGMEEEQQKQENLRDLMERAKYKNGQMLRSFAHFSLTVFGKKFCGLEDYVKFRLELANEQQKDILAFLSLTHVFTDHALPARALARLLNKSDVVMKSEFQDVYLRELLSPPAHETDSRRISFLDVAEEILKQLAETTKLKTVDEDDESGDEYWSFIKYVSLKMAREVLSVNIGASKIDRLTRKLFIISEYESEKFSSLIRSMKNDNPDIARDTLLELVEVFKEHDSFKAHLLAHLAKYYMIEYKDFKEAKPRIEEAVQISPEDALLHHIHGDIIRHHVEALKSEEEVKMDDIVFFATESSNCFQIVRDKRPRMSHGFASDAMVRITVMQAAIKAMEGGTEVNFVDYLIQIIDKWIDEGGKLTYDKKYLLALITDAYEYLNENSIDFEYKDKLMERFMCCIQNVTELNKLCEKLKSVKKSFTGKQAWIGEVIIQTYSLLCVLEIERTENMTPEELEIRIKKIEECGSRSKLDERSMKYWFRYARDLTPPPTLQDASKKVKQWIESARRKNRISPHAEFYNYVVCLLTALKDPNDKEKMKKAAELVNRQHHRKSSKEEVSKFPHMEWLRPKVDQDINSIDSLLHNDNLLKKKTQAHPPHQRRLRKEVIERCLRKCNVARWDGVVKAIKSDWHGTISFKSYIDVYFVPQNVRPDRPAIGDTVHFYLSFDWNGPSAWSVNRSGEPNVRKSSRYTREKSYSNNENEVEEEDDEEEETNIQVVVSAPLYSACIPEQNEEEDWEQYVDKRMTGAVVQMFSERGFGYVSHPRLSSNLWFHVNQHLPITFCEEGITKYMVLEFIVKRTSDGKLCANNIHVMEDTYVDDEMRDYVLYLKKSIDKKERKIYAEAPNPKSLERRELIKKETGTVKKVLVEKRYGFITADSLELSKDIFFHERDFADRETPKPGDCVEFHLTRNEKGYIARDVVFQTYTSSDIDWEHESGESESGESESGESESSGYCRPESGGWGRSESGGYGRTESGGYGRTKSGGYGRRESGGYGRTESGGYGRTKSGGYGRTESGGYGRTESGGYGRTESGGYGRTESGGYGRTESGGYGRTKSGGYGRTESGGYGRTKSGGYGRTESGGYGRTESGGYGRPESGDYGRPESGGWDRPESGGYGLPESGGYNRQYGDTPDDW